VKHNKHTEVKTLIENNMNVLLTGERGSGKSTLLMEVAEELDYEFVSITGTRQTTVGSLLGFISVTGTYIPSLLRSAVEDGKMFVIEEMDGMDPNTLLCLNTLENGYLAFPDGLVNVHDDFRLCATANPSTEHHIYTGRSSLDAASLDRFDEVTVERDKDLEIHLTDEETYHEISLMRLVLSDNSSSKTLSMRDTLRSYQRKQIGLYNDKYLDKLLGDKDFISMYKKKLKDTKPKKVLTQQTATNIDDLWDVVNKTKGN